MTDRLLALLEQREALLAEAEVSPERRAHLERWADELAIEIGREERNTMGPGSEAL